MEQPFNPSIITINGDTFQQAGSEPPRAERKGKKAKVPSM
jgi:hypothetical protein